MVCHTIHTCLLCGTHIRNCFMYLPHICTYVCNVEQIVCCRTKTVCCRTKMSTPLQAMIMYHMGSEILLYGKWNRVLNESTDIVFKGHFSFQQRCPIKLQITNCNVWNPKNLYPAGIRTNDTLFVRYRWASRQCKTMFYCHMEHWTHTRKNPLKYKKSAR
jgi:hypothetical protein